MIFLLLFGLLTFAFIDAVTALKNIANTLSKLPDKQKVRNKDYIETDDGVVYEFLGFDENMRPIVKDRPDIKLLPPNPKNHHIHPTKL